MGADYIAVNGIRFEIRRNARRKNIAVGVDDGVYFAAAPQRVSRKELESLLLRNFDETIEALKEKLAAQVAKKDEQIKSLEMKIASLQRANEVKEDAVLAYGKEAEKMVTTINGLKESATKYWNDLQEAETKLDEKEDEIIRLKAKLYDLMVK